MTGIFVSHRAKLRKIASAIVKKRDGSIILTLTRDGTNTSGWQWDSSTGTAVKVEYSKPVQKNKLIVVHTSGRINYSSEEGREVSFIPCLLDLTEAIPLLTYSIPSLEDFREFDHVDSSDLVLTLDNQLHSKLVFEFFVVPATVHFGDGVVGFIVEGRYGIACRVASYEGIQLPDGVPSEVFTVLRPASRFKEQQISEELAFVRFQQLMYENQVRRSLLLASIPQDEHESIIEGIVQRGFRIQGPNAEGTYEIVCVVPMRIKPKLVVVFVDKRYSAKVIDIRREDNRLERVRVRFEVYDQEGRLVKTPVEIASAALDAELN